MKCIQIVGSLEATGGGPSYTVPRLAEELTANGWKSEIATLTSSLSQTQRGVPITVFEPDEIPVPQMAKLGRSHAMKNGLSRLGADILHSHGLWMMPNVYPADIARHEGLPFLLAPRGMLGEDALKFSSSVKKIFWAIWQKRALSQVSCYHATAESEYEDIRKAGLKGPVAIIPNGVDLPPQPIDIQANHDNAPFILSLGRLHPKKGLETLITSFARVAEEFPNWHLRIVGIDEDKHSDVLQKRICACDLNTRVTIEHAVFGDQKTKLMTQAELFALPSLHENFAVTVAESLAVETPVISSMGAPWAGLEANRCGWWVNHGVEPLAENLRAAMSLTPKTRKKMGERGREWMRRDFAWEGIGKQMGQTYDWLMGQETRPNFIIE